MNMIENDKRYFEKNKARKLETVVVKRNKYITSCYL